MGLGHFFQNCLAQRLKNLKLGGTPKTLMISELLWIPQTFLWVAFFCVTLYVVATDHTNFTQCIFKAFCGHIPQFITLNVYTPFRLKLEKTYELRGKQNLFRIEFDFDRTAI